MQFDYFPEVRINASIDIDDIGNTCIMACNDNGEEYYFLSQTSIGESRMIEYGPIIRDIDDLGDNCICNFTKLKYSQFKISKTIESFLNNPRRQITQATEIDKEDFFAVFKNSLDYMEVK